MADPTPLRGALVSDIPAMLRRMADKIEAKEIEADSVLFIIDKPGDWPEIFGWGEHLSDYGNIAVCELARAWFVRELTEG
jgi:hypothetical protein